MSVTSAAYYPPVAAFQPGYVSRLALIEPRAPFFDWDVIVARVPQLVDKALSTIDSVVWASNPNAAAHSGKNTIRSESLFVYRTYTLGTSDVDAVVVGLTVERDVAHVTIRGDIANEESGNVYSELKIQSLAGDDERILAGVKKAAEELASRSHIVTEAVAEL